MHAAPPVRVVLGCHWAWPVFVGACAGAATGNAAAWVLLGREIESALPVAFGCGVLVAAATAWRTHRSRTVGELHWDGAQWHWRGVAGQAHVAIDLGGWMLLRFEPGAGSRQWVAAARASTTGAWTALRAALYSRRPADPLGAPPA